MKFVTKASEDVTVSLETDHGDVDIKLNGITVAYFDGDSGRLVLLELDDDEQKTLESLGVEFSGDQIAIDV